MLKKLLTRGTAFLLLLIMLVCTVPAAEVSAKETSRKSVDKVSAEKKSPVLMSEKITLYLQGSYSTPYRVQIDNLAEDAEVSYKSSKKSVATVSKKGVVTPKKAGKAVITATVKQKGATYTLKLVCRVKAAAIKVTQGAAKKSSADKPVEICSDGKLKTGITLSGAEKISVYSLKNKKNYNIRAAVYDAKTGKALTKAKDSLSNPYISISKTGVLTAQGIPGEYYVKFVSVPKGCTARLYISVSSEKTKKEEKTTPTPEVTVSPEPAKDKEDSEPSPAPVVGPIYIPSGNPAGNQDPTGTPNPTGSPAPTGKTDPSDCKVSFALANSCKEINAQLPDTRTYKSGDEIGKLPNAYILNGIFGGWYYDAAETKPVKSTDIIDSDKTLYGNIRMAEKQQIVESPKYAVVTVPADKVSSFTFSVKGYTEGCIDKFENSANGDAVLYTVKDEKIIPTLEKGKTYGVTLSDDCTAQFVINGEEKNVSAKELTIIAEKEEVMNLSVSDDVIFIPFVQVSELKGQLFDGLFSATVGSNGTSGTDENKYEGSFKYFGEGIKAGDTVAIYEGLRPDQRDFSVLDTKDDGAVAYVTITGKNGNTYSFKTADSQDVLKKPEVLPVPLDADTDGNASDHSITVSKSVFDYSDSKYSKLGLDDTTTVDADDFILFYIGSFENAKSGSYAQVTKVTENGGKLIVDYRDVTEEEVLASMDMYNNREAKINLTDEEIDIIRKDIESQALASGFLDEAADYLVALSMETDGFKELSDDLDMDLKSYNVKIVDGTNKTELSDEDRMMLMDGKGSEAKITKKEAKVYVTPGYRLQMFDGDKSGLRIELVMTLTVTIGNQDEKKDHIELELQACFEEEILLDINMDGGAVWEWAGIFPYIDDYEVSANLDWGTGVCAGVTATLKTVKGKEDKFDWKNVSGSSAEQNILDIGKQLTKLISEKEQFMGQTILDENGEEIEATSNAGGLVDKYKAFMENAQKDECWITIVEKKIFEFEGSIDPLHVLVYGVSLKFVVKMNLYITVGATYEAGEGTRYMFYMRIFDRYAKTSKKTIMEPHVNYDFYVFGTLGLKVGLEFELGVGLFSLKLDSVGITAEAGIYFTVAGYFYAHYTMSVEDGEKKKESSLSGALSMEVGFYVEIKFKAQLFSDKKFTYDPTIYENTWPLWTLGEPKNVIGFAEDEDDESKDPVDPKYKDYDDVIEMVWDMSYKMPEETFDMAVLDLFKGEDETKNFDDKTESRFTIKLSNPKFSYEPDSDYLRLNIVRGSSDREECDMTISWNGAPLAFTTKAIEKKIKIIWTDPMNSRFISFDSQGGTKVKTIALSSGEKITPPENPTRAGYIFKYWSQKIKGVTPYEIPETMPNFDKGGITVYATWAPRTDIDYTVKHYKQALNGKYELFDTEFLKGTTDTTPSIDDLKKNYDGYTLKTYSLSSIRADGKTVILIYYALNKYEVSFSFGAMKDGTVKTDDIVYSVKHGTNQAAPNMYVPGYVFDGYEGLTTDEDGCFMVTESAAYTAKWTPAEDTPYTIEHYVRVPGSMDYELYETVFRQGTTESPINPADGKYTDTRFNYVKTNIVNTDESEPVINAAGDTVIRFYYDRNTYTLTYKDGDAGLGTPAALEWGRKITKPADPTKNGYVFDAWYTDKACSATALFDFDKTAMPAADLVLYAGWKASDKTEYKVEYYGQDADNEGQYTRMDVETLYGTTDKEVTGVYKDFEHFVKNETFAARVDKAVVKADGTTLLKLYYDRETVKVTFNANGGTLGADGASKIFRYGQTFSASAPSRTKYAFEGWYNGTDKYTSTTVTATADFELTAHWKLDEVNYIAEHYVMGTNGQYPATPTYTDNTLTGKSGTEITLASLIKSDYEVAGGITYDHAAINGETLTTAAVSSGMTVKLYYKRIKHTLTWNLNGEVPVNSGDYTTGEVYYHTTVVAPTFSKTGYTYQESPSAPIFMPDSDLTIAIICTPISYTVRFNSNASDATGTMSDMTFDYDEKKALSAVSYTRKGYSFKGWSDSANGDVVYADAAQVNNLTAENGKVINLYAVWKANEYAVTLALSSNVYDNDAHFVKAEDDIKLYTYGQTITLPIPELTGYRFKGWYENTDFSGSPVEKITTASVEGKTELKYLAKWEQAVYEVNWDRNGKDDENSDVSALEDGEYGLTTSGPHYTLSDPYTADGYVYAPKKPSRNSSVEWDYTFDGWYTERLADSTASQKSRASFVDMYDNADDEDNCPPITGDVTYYAHWVKTARQYTITWYTNGRTASGRIAVNEDRVMKGGSRFGTLQNLGVEYLKSMITDGSSFTGDEGGEEFNTPGKAAYGTEIVAPSCVASDEDDPEAEYIFLGWYNVDDCEYDYETVYKLKNPATAVPLQLTDTVTGDMTFVAIWKVTAKDCTMTWNGNSTDTAVTLTGDYTGKNGNVAMGTVIVAPTAERASSESADYTFEGWYSQPTGGSKITDFGTIQGDTTYYAHWTMTPRYYSVKFEYRNGEGTKEVKVRYEQSIDKADPQYSNISDNKNVHGYNADYPAALKAAYTDIGGQYSMATEYPGTGQFWGWYVCNSEGQPITVDGEVAVLSSEYCTWEQYYAVEKNRKITSDIIVKANWYYDFYFCGKQLSTYYLKTTDILNGVGGVQGCAYYDPDTMTLTLDGLSIDASNNDKDIQSGTKQNFATLAHEVDGFVTPLAFCVEGATLTIKLAGTSDNAIKVCSTNGINSGKNVAAIYAKNANVTISGSSDATLDLYAGYKNSYQDTNATAGIWLTDGNYVQDCCSVNIEAGQQYSTLLNDLSINARVSDCSGYSYGIKAEKISLDCTKGQGALCIYSAIDHLGYALDGDFEAKGKLDDIRVYAYGHRSISGAPEVVEDGHCSCNTGNLDYCPAGAWMNNAELNIITPGNSCDYYVYCKNSGMLSDERVMKYNELVLDYYSSTDTGKYYKIFTVSNS